MLSVGPRAPGFPPSENIRVILSLPPYGNVHYRHHPLSCLRIIESKRRATHFRLPEGLRSLIDRLAMRQCRVLCTSPSLLRSSHWLTSCEHALASALTTAKAFDERRNRCVRRDSKARQSLAGQHPNVSAMKILDSHAWFGTQLRL